MKKVLLVTAGNVGRGGVQKFLLDWVTVSHRLNEKIEYTWYVPLKMQDEGLLKEFHTQGVKVIVADIPSSYNKLERTKKFRRDISSILKN